VGIDTPIQLKRKLRGVRIATAINYGWITFGARADDPIDERSLSTDKREHFS
jgi:hypothetical protein